MKKTTHYQLNKPDGTDYADISQLNLNADTVDAALHGLETSKETPAGAQAKADAARDAAKAASRPASWTPTASEVGAAPSTHVGDASHVTPAEKQGWDAKAAGNHSHTPAEVGAAAANHSHTASEVGAAPASHGHTAGQVGADPAGAAQGVQNNLNSHTNSRSNPHGVSPGQIGAMVGFGPTIITVYVGSWSGSAPFTQTVSVGGVTASDNHLHLYPVDIADKAARDLYNKAVGCLAAEADTVYGGVRLTCREKKPETTFQMSLEGARG